MAKASSTPKEVTKTKDENYKVCKKNVITRIATSAVLIPLVLFVLYLGFPFINLFILAIGAMFAYEWANMVKNSNPTFYATVYTALVAVGVLLPIPLVFMAVFLLTAIFVWFKAKKEERKWFLVLGTLYVGVGMSSILWFAQSTGFFTTVWLLIVIWATDIGAFMVGSRLRGPKLAPKISPNKTWSGFLGGLLFAVSVGMAFILGGGLADYYLPYMIMAFVISILGQIGDLIESLIKRKLGVKDSSQLIPGHGGIFDRLDSLLFVAPILVMVIALGVLFM